MTRKSGCSLPRKAGPGNAACQFYERPSTTGGGKVDTSGYLALTVTVGSAVRHPEVAQH